MLQIARDQHRRAPLSISITLAKREQQKLSIMTQVTSMPLHYCVFDWKTAEGKGI